MAAADTRPEGGFRPRGTSTPLACVLGIAAVVTVFFFGDVHAQDRAGPNFIIHTLDGPLLPAPLAKLSDDWSIHLGGKIPRAFSGKEWVSLRREGTSLPPFPSKNFALLTGGDRIALEPGGPFRVEEEQLCLRPESAKEFSVPLALLSYLCVQAPDGTADPALFLAGLDKSKRPRDVIYLKNGDRIEGTLVSSTRGPVFAMKMGERLVETPLDQIAILAVNTELQAHPRTKKMFAHLVTSGGGRLQFGSLQLEPKRGMLEGKTLFGANMELPLEQLVSLTTRQGQAVYLSDLLPKSYEFTPFFGVKWPLVADADVRGRQLFVGNDYFDKGLGMHTQSRVTYALDGAYQAFEAQVALARNTTRPGQARISVILDGQTLMARKELNQRNPVLPVRLDVRKGGTMTLLAEFGDFGDVQGRVNWADARLIR